MLDSTPDTARIAAYCVLDAAGHRSGVAEEIEVEGGIIGVSAIGRLVAHHPAGCRRNAD